MILTLVSGAIAFCAAYVFVVEPLWALGWLEWVTPNILYRVETWELQVGLSFDDGPHAVFTPQVLELLERYGAKATFFLIGERAQLEPELMARIRAAGHEIGNHWWKNRATLLASNAQFLEELEKTERVLELARGTRKSFRAPGGVAWPWQLRLARERGYTCVLGCAYPHDPMRPPIRYMRWLITKNLRPGTIVILHDGIRDASKTIALLPQILEEGARKGLRFVTIGELRTREAASDSSKLRVNK